MLTLPEPFDSSPEQFSAMVDIVAELIEAKQARLKTSPASNISFKIEPSLLTQKAQSKRIDQSAAGKILNEVSAIASLILRERIDTLIEHAVERAEEERGEKDQPKLSATERDQIKSILAEKRKLVEQKLVNDRVRQKFFSTRASKHDFLTNIRWEISDRLYDKEEAEKARDRLAVIRFEIASPPEIEFFPFFAGMDDWRRKNFVIDCDTDDIDEIIETLGQVREKLATLKG